VVFLIGDAGDPQLAENSPRPTTANPSGAQEPLIDPVLSALAADVETAAQRVGNDQTAVVFLGDNLYPKGLPPAGHADRKHGERVLDAQIAAVGSARGYVLPGNHDWERWGPEGWHWLREQEQYLETRAPRILMEPSGGCPGPSVVDFGSRLRFVFIDPAALGEDGEELWSAEAECPRHTAQAVIQDLTTEFRDFEEREVILLTHYPVITGGPHGGHFTWQEHIFPLTDFWDWAWIPLPVIGSVYPLARAMGVTATDQMNNDYRRYMAALLATKGPRAPLLIAAGHDHSLQVHRTERGRFHVVSGAGSASKVDRVMDLETSLMSIAAPGYMRLDSYADGGLELSVTAIGENGPQTVYQTCVITAPGS